MPMSPTASDREGAGLPLEGLRLRPILAAAIALAMVLVVFALPPAARASTGTLAPPYGDAGLDTDVPANGLFNYLVITVPVNVAVAGGFIFIVQLYDGTGTTQILQSQLIVDLQTGSSTVDVRLNGAQIRRSGFNGPYVSRIVMLNDTFSLQGVDAFTTTGTYLATSFEGFPAALAPPHADAGVDTNGDGRFDYLAVDAFVNVSDAGVYTVHGVLRDSPPTTVIALTSNTTFLPGGTRLGVRLRFGGTDIRAAGMNGPFNVNLSLESASRAQLGTDTYTTSGTYFLSNFVAPAASFAPPHEDYVVDLNGNGFHDYLVLNAVVSVSEPGFYSVQATIPTIPLTSDARVYLPVGTQVVQLDFIGVDIFNAGIDGPYAIDLTLSDDNGRVLDRDIHTTATYFAVDFEPSPPARWVSPTNESVRDDDRNGLWDHLVVNATVDAARRGTYEWSMEVWDSTFTTFIESVSGSWDLSSGRNPVQMLASGLQISRSGVDGPYGVDLYLSDAKGRQIDYLRLTTAAYRAADFEGIPARLTPPYADIGVDRNGDGVLDVIAVDVPVTVSRAGTFLLNGGLMDATFSVASFDQTFVDLTPGLTTVRLNFPGTDLFRSGQGGAFYGFLGLSIVENGDVISLGNDNFVTHNYTASQFDQGPAVRLSGVVRAAGSGVPLESTGVIMWSSTLRLQRQVTTDATGYYEAWLPRGSYIVVADSPSRNAAGSSVSLTANTTLDFNLDLPAPDAVTGNITFSNWDRAALRIDFTLGADAVMTRLRCDVLFGNGDGVASQAELNRILILGGTPEIPLSTRDMFTVDGTPYVRVNGTASLSVGGAGPVISSTPIVGTLTGNFTAATPVAVTPVHRSRFLSTYDAFDHTETFSLNWPATYAMKAYVPAPAVAVGGIGSSTTVVDPAADPNPRDYVTDAWLNLTIATTDATPPLVTGAALDGHSTLRMKPGPAVTVTATASDVGRGDWTISGANYTVGPRNWAASTPMSAQDGAFDSASEAVTGTLATAAIAEGTHQICVYARDIVPNNDTAGSCATLIIDNTPPATTNVRVDGQATKTVVVGTSVTLTATVSDAASGNSTVASANYTRGSAAWPGVAMGATDGAFNGPGEDVTATVSTTGWTPGTYELCVYGTDEVGNGATAQACAQLVVIDQDLTAPSVIDARALPNPANTTTAVNISANVTDNIGVDTVFIEILGPSGASVANVTASFDATTGRYYVSRVFASGGGYTYKISARDTSGNWRTATGTFTVTAPNPVGGPSLLDFWWLFVVLAVAAVAVIAIVLWSRRRRAGPATEPTSAPAPKSGDVQTAESSAPSTEIPPPPMDTHASGPPPPPPPHP
jgi:hypothetical protein